MSDREHLSPLLPASERKREFEMRDYSYQRTPERERDAPAMMPQIDSPASLAALKKQRKSTTDSPFTAQMRQVKALLKKNFWIYRKDWRMTSVAILSPIIFMVLLYVLQEVYAHEMNKIGSFPDADEVPRIPQCTSWGGNTCWTLMYSVVPANSSQVNDLTSASYTYRTHKKNDTQLGCGPDHLVNIEGCTNIPDKYTKYNVTQDWTEADQIMAYVALHNTPPLTVSHSIDDTADIVRVPTGNDLFAYLLDHTNSTQNAVLFHQYEGEIIAYTVLYNNSRASEKLVPTVIRSVDEAIQSLSTNSSITITISEMGYPKSKPRFLSNSIVQMAGPVFFFCPPMFIFILLLNQIVNEKQMKLRQGMKVMGLSDSMFWLSWFITGAILYLIVTLALVGSGRVMGFEYFTNTEWGINFLVFYLFSLSLIPFIFLCSTFVSTTKQANLLGFIVFLIGLFLQMIFTSVAIYYWYGDDAPEIYLRLFSMYPAFNFAKCCADIVLLTYPSYSSSSSSYVSAPGYKWVDLVKEVYSPTLGVHAPPTIMSFLLLGCNGLVFAILTWYFDNVLSGVNGISKPFYFPLQPSYWEIYLNKVENLHESRITEMERAHLEATQRDADDSHSVEIKHLKKSYRKYRFCASGKDMHAVKDLTLSIPAGTVYCLLGHNGAGKTTTINMLTGITLPTSGTAKIFGCDIVENQDALRQIMGVCPQHDILWEDLTPRQHLLIFSELQAIPSASLKRTIEQKLEEVSLHTVADKKVRTFSGGMKRRLSVAISSICNPKMIFFDEPTTGLDPVSKRGVWDLIKKLKEGRVLVLTTHSMEEADYLADQIGIMAKGTLRVSDNSMNLKNKHGNGYKISLVTTVHRVAELQQLVSAFLPEARLVVSNAGSLTYTLAQSKLKSLSTFFQHIEDTESLRSIIEDWGISHSSLEEVFHNITNMSEEEAELLKTKEDDAMFEDDDIDSDYLAFIREAPMQP